MLWIHCINKNSFVLSLWVAVSGCKSTRVTFINICTKCSVIYIASMKTDLRIVKAQPLVGEMRLNAKMRTFEKKDKCILNLFASSLF